MRISLFGIGSETLLTEFDSIGVKYIRNLPPVGTAMNAGDTIQLIRDISGLINWDLVALGFIAWLKYRPSRKILAIDENNKMLRTEGLTAKEFESLLPLCKTLTAIETKKPDEAPQPP